jgi:DNA-binding transcriptional regulator YiaG
MKKIQCTGCGQVFWTDLQVEEALVLSGEWVQQDCPKCQAEWAVVEPEATVIRGRGRVAKPGPKRRGGPRRKVQAQTEGVPVKGAEGEQELSPKGIRKLRKKLGLSQTKLGSLVGVSLSTVVSWEKGKYSPRQDKVAQLSELAKKGKEEIERLVPKKEAKGELEKSAEKKVRGKRGAGGRVRGKKAGKAKRVARPRRKAIKSAEIAAKAAANSVTVAKDLKTEKKD